jgi:hypothetical protein
MMWPSEGFKSTASTHSWAQTDDPSDSEAAKHRRPPAPVLPPSPSGAQKWDARKIGTFNLYREVYIAPGL